MENIINSLINLLNNVNNATVRYAVALDSMKVEGDQVSLETFCLDNDTAREVLFHIGKIKGVKGVELVTDYVSRGRKMVAVQTTVITFSV